MTLDGKRFLVTGGCGFVGSSLAMQLKQRFPECSVCCLDNLKRRGSELNISRLTEQGIRFEHGDIRNPEDLEAAGPADWIFECSAEPSVLAGFGGSPEYCVNTNLTGTIHCLEHARRCGAGFMFLSTSRVYPMAHVNGLDFVETETRFELSPEQKVSGAGSAGIAEGFPLDGSRSLYGATKLCSELLIQEYVEMYGLKAVINRCGVLAGPGQFGKVDQGVVVLWAAKHFWKKKLSYISFGGLGKQVRDILHVDDLFDLLVRQIENIDVHSGQIYNVGGGRESSVSLRELTALCQKATGNEIEITSDPQDRPADIRIYLSDTAKVRQATGWAPQKGPEQIIQEIVDWLRREERILKPLLA